MTIENPAHDERFPGNNWVLPTDIDLVSVAEDELVSRLEAVGWPRESDKVLDFCVAFREALINAIAHGNLGVSIPEGSLEDLGTLAKAEQERNPTDKKVFVDIEADEKQVSVVIRDEGPGFKVNDVPDPTESIDAKLKPKGRGLLFMRSFTDSVVYNEIGNQVTLVKARK